MPTMKVTPDLEMFYRLDDFTDPWHPSDVVLCMHGVGENGVMWGPWVPHLGRTFRVLRPDMRGFGQSSPMPVEHHWSLDRLAADYDTLLDGLGFDQVHVIGAKLGGMLAMHYAATRPGRVITLSVLGSPISGKQIPTPHNPHLQKAFNEGGVEAWAWGNMDRRLGKDFPLEGKKWWGKMMGATAASTLKGLFRDEAAFEVSHELELITCPAFIVTTTGSGLGTVDQVRTWQRRIPRSELLVMEGDSFHAAASTPDAAAEATLAFLRRHKRS